MKSGQKPPSSGQVLELIVIATRAISFALKGISFRAVQRAIGNPKKIFEFFKDFFASMEEGLDTLMLKLICDAESLKVGPTSGNSTINNANSVFKFISHKFVDWHLDHSQDNSEPSTGVIVNFHETTTKGKFSDIFYDLSDDLDELILKQRDIIWICEEKPEWLNQEAPENIFLIKNDDQYFVVRVDVFSEGLHVDVSKFEDDYQWAEGYWVITPKLL